MPVADICHKAGISQATYFNWKKRYDGLLPTEMRRLKQLEDENSKVKKLDASGRDPPKAVRPVRKRKLVDEMRGEWSVSIRRACRVLLVDTSTYHYNLVAPNRLVSNNASRRFAGAAFAMVIGVCMSCCVARVGGSTRRRHDGCIPNWACNCAIRRPSAGLRRSCVRIGATPRTERDLGHGLCA